MLWLKSSILFLSKFFVLFSRLKCASANAGFLEIIKYKIRCSICELKSNIRFF
jgi:hypothetical protein